MKNKELLLLKVNKAINEIERLIIREKDQLKLKKLREVRKVLIESKAWDYTTLEGFINNLQNLWK